MKPRPVILTIEMETSYPIKTLLAYARADWEGGTVKVLQVQANVIRPTKKRAAKRGKAKR